MIKVLVVDDDADLLEMITMMLTANNMNIQSLSGGTSLFQMLSAQRPDLLLMDIFLGDSDGRQLCKQMKNSGQYSDVPVLLYSAGEISTASIKESEADHFFRKPFEMHQLVNVIRESVKK
ncbi:MAG: response regulator [Chitinophagaceae bacterium]